MMNYFCLAVDASVRDGSNEQRDSVLLWEHSSRTRVPLERNQKRHPGHPNTTFRGENALVFTQVDKIITFSQ